MKFKSLLILFLVLIFGILVVSSVSATDSLYISVSPVSATDYTDMVQYDDYFFGIDYLKIDYNVGYDYFNNTNSTPGNDACSAFSKDGMVARSYDWTYDDKASIVIHVSDAKYKNIGVAARIFSQEDCLNIINNVGDYNYKLEVLPFIILDGMNEKGVYCNNNMVPKEEDGDIQNGRYARAAIESKVVIHVRMLPRFIVDNFASAKEAAEYIRDYCDVYNNDNQIALHTMVADSSGACYVLEFFDNKTQVNENQNVMTNFYVSGVKFNENGTVPTPLTNEGNVTGAGNLTLHSAGLERYNIIINDYDNLNTVDDFWNTLHKVRFTNYALSTDPVWASDLADIDAPLNESSYNRELVKYLYDHRSRDMKYEFWQSIHQCVYDLNNLVLYVETQEKDGYHVFELNKDIIIDVYGLDDLKTGKESEITVLIECHGKALHDTQVCIDIFSDKNELLYSGMGYTNDEGIFTFQYTPSEAGKQSLVVTVVDTSKTVDFEVSSNETSNQTVSATTIPMEATGNSLAIVLVLFILMLSLGYIAYRKDNI